MNKMKTEQNLALYSLDWVISKIKPNVCHVLHLKMFYNLSLKGFACVSLAFEMLVNNKMNLNFLRRA